MQPVYRSMQYLHACILDHTSDQWAYYNQYVSILFEASVGAMEEDYGNLALLYYQHMTGDGSKPQILRSDHAGALRRL